MDRDDLLSLQYHSITEALETHLPLLEGAEFEDLRDDIALHGIRQPIWLYQGLIIDGRNRYRAWKLLTNEGLDIDLPIREWDGRGSLVALVLALNVRRRHLAKQTRDFLAAKAAALMEEESRLKRKAALKQGAKSPSVSNDTDGKNTGDLQKTDQKPNRSRDKAAALAGTSPASAARATKVLKDGIPELIEAAESLEIATAAAAEIAAMPPEQQLEEIERRRSEAHRVAVESELVVALGKGGSHLESAAKSLAKAAKVLHGYDARKTLAAIAKAQDRLADDTARLLAEARG